MFNCVPLSSDRSWWCKCCSSQIHRLILAPPQYKRSRKISSVPIDEEKRTFLTSLLEVLLTKMKWDSDADLDDIDEDDNAEFEKMRKVRGVSIL